MSHTLKLTEQRQKGRNSPPRAFEEEADGGRSFPYKSGGCWEGPEARPFPCSLLVCTPAPTSTPTNTENNHHQHHTGPCVCAWKSAPVDCARMTSRARVWTLSWACGGHCGCRGWGRPATRITEGWGFQAGSAPQRQAPWVRSGPELWALGLLCWCFVGVGTWRQEVRCRGNTRNHAARIQPHSQGGRLSQSLGKPRQVCAGTGGTPP